MPFGTESSIFRQHVADAFAPDPGFGAAGAAGGGWDNRATGHFKVALYDNTVPGATGPDRLLPGPTYGVAPWAAGEVTDGTVWPAGGLDLANPDMQLAQGIAVPLPPWPPSVNVAGIQLLGDDTGTGNDTVNFPDVRGDLLYIPGYGPNKAVAFHSFGGIQTVTDGTFTIIWHPTGGIMVVTVQLTA